MQENFRRLTEDPESTSKDKGMSDIEDSTRTCGRNMSAELFVISNTLGLAGFGIYALCFDTESLFIFALCADIVDLLVFALCADTVDLFIFALRVDIVNFDRSSCSDDGCPQLFGDRHPCNGDNSLLGIRLGVSVFKLLYPVRHRDEIFPSFLFRHRRCHTLLRVELDILVRES